MNHLPRIMAGQARRGRLLLSRLTDPLMLRRCAHYHGFLVGLFFGSLAAEGQSSRVVGWGLNTSGQTTPPLELSALRSLSAGGNHSLALRANGTVVGWGFNPRVPLGLSGVMALASGGGHDLALRSNRTVVAWGDNSAGQTRVPVGLSNVVALAAGLDHSLALKADGTVVAWGNSSTTNVPPGLADVIAIAGGDRFSLAVRSDGTVVGWGSSAVFVPPGLHNVVAVAAGRLRFGVALKSDGTVTAWGGRADVQRDVPTGLSNVVAIAAGSDHALALKADGTVAAWGLNTFGPLNVPAAASNLTVIAAGYDHSLGLSRSAPPSWPRITAQPQSARRLVGDAVAFSVTAQATASLSYQWQYRGHDVANATNASLVLNELRRSDAGDYAVVVSVDSLRMRSAPAFLAVSDRPVALSQTVEGREDVELVIQLQASGPSDLPLLATLVSLPAAGRLFQVDAGQRGLPIDSVPALIPADGILIYVPAPDRYGRPYDSFFFAARNELGESLPARILINIVPVNDPPVAILQVSSPSLHSSNAPAHFVLLAPGNASAVLVLDASLSSDVDADPLQFLWLEQDTTIPFASGLRVTNVLGVGAHEILLQVSDGSTTAATAVTVEVITPGEAVEEIVALLATVPAGHRNGPLIASLKAAIASLDRGDLTSGLNVLRAFQHKVRAQVAPNDPVLAQALLEAVEHFLEVLTGR
jgi:hypothetical protein